MDSYLRFLKKEEILNKVNKVEELSGPIYHLQRVLSVFRLEDCMALQGVIAIEISDQMRLQDVAHDLILTAM